MTESEFLAMADTCLQQVQDIFEQAFENDEMDVDCKRSGNVLEVEFVTNGSKLIVNSQAPMQEMWVAARSGGFHYKHDGQHWRNTRDNSELFATLKTIAEAQSQQCQNNGGAIEVRNKDVLIKKRGKFPRFFAY